MACVNRAECDAVGLDARRVASIARRLSKAAKEAEAMGMVVFGGSGSGTLRFDDGGRGRLIVADLEGNFDGAADPGRRELVRPDMGRLTEWFLDAYDRRVTDLLVANNREVERRRRAEERVVPLLKMLRKHHDWHLQSGSVGLPTGEGGWIEIDNALEYSDSTMCAETVEVLRDGE